MVDICACVDLKSSNNELARAVSECEVAEGALSVAILRANEDEVSLNLSSVILLGSYEVLALSRSLLATLFDSEKTRECPPRVVQKIRSTLAEM